RPPGVRDFQRRPIGLRPRPPVPAPCGNGTRQRRHVGGAPIRSALPCPVLSGGDGGLGRLLLCFRRCVGPRIAPDEGGGGEQRPLTQGNLTHLGVGAVAVAVE